MSRSIRNRSGVGSAGSRRNQGPFASPLRADPNLDDAVTGKEKLQSHGLGVRGLSGPAAASPSLTREGEQQLGSSASKASQGSRIEGKELHGGGRTGATGIVHGYPAGDPLLKAPLDDAQPSHSSSPQASKQIYSSIRGQAPRNLQNARLSQSSSNAAISSQNMPILYDQGARGAIEKPQHRNPYQDRYANAQQSHDAFKPFSNLYAGQAGPALEGEMHGQDEDMTGADDGSPHGMQQILRPANAPMNDDEADEGLASSHQSGQRKDRAQLPGQLNRPGTSHKRGGAAQAHGSHQGSGSHQPGSQSPPRAVPNEIHSQPDFNIGKNAVRITDSLNGARSGLGNGGNRPLSPLHPPNLLGLNLNRAHATTTQQLGASAGHLRHPDPAVSPKSWTRQGVHSSQSGTEEVNYNRTQSRDGRPESAGPSGWTLGAQGASNPNLLMDVTMQRMHRESASNSNVTNAHLYHQPLGAAPGPSNQVGGLGPHLEKQRPPAVDYHLRRDNAYKKSHDAVEYVREGQANDLPGSAHVAGLPEYTEKQKFWRKCCQMDDLDDPHAHQKGCMNYNLIKFDPKTRARQQRLKSGAGSGDQFQHRQFISRVASNKSKNQALVKYKSSHPGLYSIPAGGSGANRSSLAEEASDMATQIELNKLEAGIIDSNEARSQAARTSKPKKTSKRMSSAAQNHLKRAPVQRNKKRGKSAKGNTARAGKQPRHLDQFQPEESHKNASNQPAEVAAMEVTASAETVRDIQGIQIPNVFKGSSTWQTTATPMTQQPQMPRPNATATAAPLASPMAYQQELGHFRTFERGPGASKDAEEEPDPSRSQQFNHPNGIKSLHDNQSSDRQDRLPKAQPTKVRGKAERPDLGPMVSSSLPHPFKRSTDPHLAAQAAEEDGGLDDRSHQRQLIRGGSQVEQPYPTMGDQNHDLHGGGISGPRSMVDKKDQMQQSKQSRSRIGEREGFSALSHHKMSKHYETNTNSSQVMDEQRLGQQLQLMADQLKPLNTAELYEMQRHYQQQFAAMTSSLEQQRLGHQLVNNAQILNTSLGSGGEAATTMGAAAVGGGGPLQQDQVADIQNAINFLIEQQLQKKTDNGPEDDALADQEDREVIGPQRLDMPEQASGLARIDGAGPTHLASAMQMEPGDAAQLGADLQHIVASRAHHHNDTKAAMAPPMNRPGGYLAGGHPVSLPQSPETRNHQLNLGAAPRPDKDGLLANLSGASSQQYALSGKVMKQKSPNNKNMTYGAGYNPSQMVKNTQALSNSNSVGKFEAHDLQRLKSQDAVSGNSGGTVSNPKLLASPQNRMMQGGSNGALAPVSQHTQHIEKRPSNENFSVVGHEILSSRKAPLSPLKVVVSSTAKIPNPQNQLQQKQTQNIVKVQNIITMQNVQDQAQTKDYQQKLSKTQKVTQHKKGSKTSKQGKKSQQHQITETVFQSTESQPAKGATSIAEFPPATSNQPQAVPVDPSGGPKTETPSQRLMGFNVAQEFKEYQQKVVRDEQNQIYKYNLDRGYNYSQTKELEREAAQKGQKPKSAPGRAKSHVNIATFASNKKGEMGIRPEKAESPQNKADHGALGHDKASRRDAAARRSLAQQYLRQRKSRSMQNAFGAWGLASGNRVHPGSKHVNPFALNLGDNLAVRGLDFGQHLLMGPAQAANRRPPSKQSRDRKPSPDQPRRSRSPTFGKSTVSSQVIAKIPHLKDMPFDKKPRASGAPAHASPLVREHTLGISIRKSSLRHQADYSPGPSNLDSALNQRDYEMAIAGGSDPKIVNQQDNSPIEPSGLNGGAAADSFGRHLVNPRARARDSASNSLNEATGSAESPHLRSPGPRVKDDAQSLTINGELQSTLKRVAHDSPGTQHGGKLAEGARNRQEGIISLIPLHRSPPGVSNQNSYTNRTDAHSRSDDLEREQPFGGTLRLQRRNRPEGHYPDHLDEIDKQIIDEGLQASSAAAGRHASEEAIHVQDSHPNMREDSGSVQYIEVIQKQEATPEGQNNHTTNSMIPCEAEGEGETDSPSPQKLPQARYSSDHHGSDTFEHGAQLQPNIKEQAVPPSKIVVSGVSILELGGQMSLSRARQDLKSHDILADQQPTAKNFEPSALSGALEAQKAKKSGDRKHGRERSNSRPFDKSSSPKSPKSRAGRNNSAVGAKGVSHSAAVSPSPLAFSVYPERGSNPREDRGAQGAERVKNGSSGASATNAAEERPRSGEGLGPVGSGSAQQALSPTKRRRPISPQEYQGGAHGRGDNAAHGKGRYKDSRQAASKPIPAHTQDDRMKIVDEAKLSPTLRASPYQVHLNQSYPNSTHAPHPMAGVMRSAGNQGKPGLMSSPSSQEGAAGIMSAENLRAMLNTAHGPSDALGQMLRSSTAAGIEQAYQEDHVRIIQKNLSASIRPPANGDRSNSSKSPENQGITSQQRAKKSLTIFPRVGSDSRMGRSLHGVQSSNKQEEFSVAEMSAQVMLDQNEGATEASHQLNASFAGANQFSPGLGANQFLNHQHPNIISINNIQRRQAGETCPDSANLQSVDESQFLNSDLELVCRETIRQLEARRRAKLDEETRASLMQYIMDHRETILKLKVKQQDLPRRKYLEKQLVENPGAKSKRNYRAFRKQEDNDIHLRHIQNDKRFHQTRQEFTVKGKKLHTIKHNILQQQIYAFIQQQAEAIQLQAPKAPLPRPASSGVKSTVSVNIKAPNVIENFQQYILPSISSGQNLPSASCVHSTRRTVTLNQRQQQGQPVGANQNATIQQVFSSIGLGHSGLNAVSGQPQSPLTRGGESLQINDRLKASLLTSGQPTISNVAVVQALQQKQVTSNRSFFTYSRGLMSRERLSGGSSSPRRSPRARDVNQRITINAIQSSGSRERSHPILHPELNQTGQTTYKNNLSGTQAANLLNVDQNPPNFDQQSAFAKQMTSSAVSISGYGGGGMYGIAGEGVLQSPRMQHLQASAAYSGKDALKTSLKEASLQHDPDQNSKIRKSNYKDSAREGSPKNMLNQSQEDNQSNYQTDEMCGSQTARKMMKELRGPSQEETSGKMRSSATPGLIASGSVQHLKEQASNPLDQNQADKRNAHRDNERSPQQQAYENSPAPAFAEIMLERQQPVKSVQVVMTPREAKSNLSIKMKFDQGKGGQHKEPQLMSPTLHGGNQVSYPTTSAANQPQQPPQDNSWTLPLHLIGKKHARPDGKMGSHQSLSMRNDKGLNAKQSGMEPQAITPDGTPGNPNARRGLGQHAGGKNSQESLKKMTINESEQQISNYHITRPVMSGSPLAVAGYGTGNSQDLHEKMLRGVVSPPDPVAQQDESQFQLAASPTGVVDLEGENSQQEMDKIAGGINREASRNAKQIGKPVTPQKSQHIGQNVGESANRKKLLSNLSNESASALLAGEKLKRVGHRDDSADTLDLNGLIQPKSLRAKIDLKEGPIQTQGEPAESRRNLTSSQDLRLIEMSKSRVLDQIGRSFQNQNFKNTAKNISNNLRKSKGLPLDPQVNKRHRASNIELGGADTSVRVSVVRSGSDQLRAGTSSVAGDVAAMSGHGSRLAPRAPSQHSKSRDGNPQRMSQQEKELLIGSIVQNYTSKNLAEKSHRRIVLDDQLSGSLELPEAHIQKGEVLLKQKILDNDSSMRNHSRTQSLNRSTGQSRGTRAQLRDPQVLMAPSELRDGNEQQEADQQSAKNRQALALVENGSSGVTATLGADRNAIAQVPAEGDFLTNNTLSPLAHSQHGRNGDPHFTSGAANASAGIFDERKSQAEMRLHKTSRLNQRLMRGPGGLAQNMIGAIASSPRDQQPESKILPAQRQVNYVLKNPTTHELSNSRLIENSKVLRGNAQRKGASRSKQNRLNSAIAQGNLRSSYGYAEREGKNREGGGLVPQGAEPQKPGALSGLLTPVGTRGDGGEPSVSEANHRLTKANRLTSAGRGSGTHASTAVKDSLLGGIWSNKQLDNAQAASNHGERRVGQHLEKQIEERSESDYFDQRRAFPSNPPNDRTRPKTAKVSGFVNNLRHQSAKYGTTRASNAQIVQSRAGGGMKPARIESAHPAATAGLQPHHQMDRTQNSSSFHVTQSFHHPSTAANNVAALSQSKQARVISRRMSSVHGGNTVGVLSKVSGGRSSYNQSASATGGPFTTFHYQNQQEPAYCTQPILRADAGLSSKYHVPDLTSNRDLLEQGVASTQRREAAARAMQETQQQDAQDASRTGMRWPASPAAASENLKGPRPHITLLQQRKSNPQLLYHSGHTHGHNSVPSVANAHQSTNLHHAGVYQINILQAGKLLVVDGDTQRSGKTGRLSDFAVPSPSANTGGTSGPKSWGNRLAGRGHQPQGHTNGKAGRKVRRGPVFKDENFEAKMRNGRNGVVLL